MVDDPDRMRYEIFVGDTLAGFATYRRAGDHIVILHSEVLPEFEHHGLASHLAQATLDDIRRRGLRVVPQCPFFATYVREHPEYDDLVFKTAL